MLNTILAPTTPIEGARIFEIVYGMSHFMGKFRSDVQRLVKKWVLLDPFPVFRGFQKEEIKNGQKKILGIG